MASNGAWGDSAASASFRPPAGDSVVGGGAFHAASPWAVAGTERWREECNAADDRALGAPEGAQSRAKRCRAAQHHPHPVQRAAGARRAISLRLTATDLDIEISEAAPAEVERAGSTTAPANYLYDFVRKLPENAAVKLDVSGRRSALVHLRGQVALAFADPAGGRFSLDAVGRFRDPLRDRADRAGAPDRQDALRHLHRRDALLSQRHFLSHRGEPPGKRRCARSRPMATASRSPTRPRPRARRACRA